MEDWEKKFWSLKQQQQHSQYQKPQTSAYPEIDITAQLQQRAMNFNQPEREGVFLREGGQYYRQIQGGDGFGNTMPLVRSMGPLANVYGKQFVVMGDFRGYCIDNLQQVDLSKINEEPERMLVLVRVRAPFAGDMLVPKSAIIESSNAGKQLLRG